jgi:hypothetical protein
MLKILYSSLLIQDGININYEKSIFPLDNYYNFSKKNSSIELNINFDNIKKCIYEGKIIPQRLQLFKVLKYYYNIECKNKIKNIFINKYVVNKNQKILGNNILQIEDIFFDLDNQSIYKNLFPFSCDGGIYLEKFIFGRYSRDKKFEELILKKTTSQPSIICVSNNRLNFWKTLLEDRNSIILNNYSNLKKTTYRDISKAKFVLVTINLLNNVNYKNKFNEYKINNEYSEQTFLNIKNDLYQNENLQWEYEPLLNIINWETCIVDFCFEEIKKNMNDIFLKFIAEKKWIIFNEFIKNKDNIETIKNIFNSDISYLDLEQFLISGNNFLPKIQGNIQKEFLEFNKNETNGYINYINDFDKIYKKNNLKFEDDQYLQKYCSFPQTSLKINKILKNLNDTEKLNTTNLKYKNLIQNQLNSGKIDCKICLEEINEGNIGLTECGHFFCFSCIYKNIKYSNTCPTCRRNISFENIYLITNSKKNILLDKEILDELGTKNRALLLNIKNYKKILIVSNFSDGLEKISLLLNQLNLNTTITKNDKKFEEGDIYLSNYNEDFFNMKDKINPEIVLFLEPYYSEDFEIKIYEIYKSMKKPELKFLIIKDSIEDNFINKFNMFQ